MTRIYNAERGFKDELLEGLTSAYGRYLRRVPGASAVMSVDAPIPGQVSVIIGGGSGHYPAFAGLVGPGLCHGAVVGEVFTSPSAAQAYRAITALDGGAGVLLTFGNYSGDVMHFGLGRGAGARRRHRYPHRARDGRRGERPGGARRRPAGYRGHLLRVPCGISRGTWRCRSGQRGADRAACQQPYPLVRCRLRWLHLPGPIGALVPGRPRHHRDRSGHPW